LDKCRLIIPIKIKPIIRNIVAQIDIKKKLSLEKLARIIPRSMYEPEQFPTLIYNIHGSCTVLLFSSGKGVIAGAKSIEDLNSALFEIKSRIK